jgi:regulator of cell morphogenesis and NO signaling
MSIPAQTIREIVSTQSSAAAVLQRFDIDLCSHAGDSLEKTCGDLQLSVDQVLQKLASAAAGEPGSSSIDVSGYTLTRLSEMTQKLADKHGERAPALKTVRSRVEILRAEMLAHLEKEEQILFPLIAQMEEEMTGGAAAHACFRTMAHTIAMMVSEHESAKGLLIGR